MSDYHQFRSFLVFCTQGRGLGSFSIDALIGRTTQSATLLSDRLPSLPPQHSEISHDFDRKSLSPARSTDKDSLYSSRDTSLRDANKSPASSCAGSDDALDTPKPRHSVCDVTDDDGCIFYRNSNSFNGRSVTPRRRDDVGTNVGLLQRHLPPLAMTSSAALAAAAIANAGSLTTPSFKFQFPSHSSTGFQSPPQLSISFRPCIPCLFPVPLGIRGSGTPSSSSCSVIPGIAAPPGAGFLSSVVAASGAPLQPWNFPLTASGVVASGAGVCAWPPGGATDGEPTLPETVGRPLDLTPYRMTSASPANRPASLYSAQSHGEFNILS